MTTPPIEMQADQAASWAFTVVGACFFAFSLGWALRERRRTGTWLAVLALAGGLIAALEEAWIDHIIKLWYPADAPLVVFTAMEVPQPLYVFLVYPGFVGLGAYVTYRGLLSRPNGGWLWPTFAAICVMDLAFELPITTAGVDAYYGDQPFQAVADAWPAWVAPINAAGPILAGWCMWHLAPRLHGVRRLMIALLPPLCYAGVYGAAGWPTQTLLDSGAPAVFTWLAASASMLFAAAIVWLIRLTLPDSGQAGRIEPELGASRRAEPAAEPAHAGGARWP